MNNNPEAHQQPYQTTDRRSFLKGLAGGAAALAAFPSSGAAADGAGRPLITTTMTGEPYWQLVKEQFVIKQKLIMLNAANLCPAPHMVRDTVSRLTDDLDADVSFQNRAKFDLLREAARRKLAAFMGASEDEIAIVRNTSEANNIIVTGLDLGSGDEVLVFDQNHPTNNVAWDVRAARRGFTVKRVSVSDHSREEEILKSFRTAFTARTKVLSITDVSNTSGIRLPSRELCRMAGERGIYTHVDGAQTFGALSVNLREMGCDSYSGSAHKWFLGPKEAGLLFVKQERIGQIWPGVVGVGWGSKAETSARGARKFETLGQRNDGVVSAMGTAVDFLNLIGGERIQARVLELAAMMKEEIRKIPGAKLRTPIEARLSAGVCVFTVDGVDSQRIYEALYAKHGIAGAATGGVRFCPHIYNTHEEIGRTLSALKQVIKEA